MKRQFTIAKFAVEILLVMTLAGIIGLGLFAGISDGVYSCCGNPTCTNLLATEACPNGRRDCSLSSLCCEDRCNDPDPMTDTQGLPPTDNCDPQ